MVLRENARKSRRSPIGLVPLRGTIMSENLEKVATFAACGTTDPAPACGSADPASACGSADPTPAYGTACGAADTQ